MSYRIYNQVFEKDSLLLILYDPDTKQTHITFSRSNLKQTKFKSFFYIPLIPVITFIKDREITFTVDGKIDIPTNLLNSDVFSIDEEIFSISYKDISVDEYSITTFYYILPYIYRKSKETHTTLVKFIKE